MALLSPLEWDSRFFGFPIARVDDSVRTSDLGFTVQAADDQGFRCTYLLVPAGDYDLINCAQKLGFVLYDIRVEFNRPVSGHIAASSGVRLGLMSDLPRIRNITYDRFSGTRFFADKCFSRERSAELYVEWVRRGLNKEGDWMTLVTPDVSGFVVCHIDRSASTGVISLIGVSRVAEGKGLGRTLMAGAGQLFLQESLSSAVVATQGHNIAAQRLYQAHGYRTVKTSIWLHRWSQIHGDRG